MKVYLALPWHHIKGRLRSLCEILWYSESLYVPIRKPWLRKNITEWVKIRHIFGSIGDWLSSLVISTDPKERQQENKWLLQQVSIDPKCRIPHALLIEEIYLFQHGFKQYCLKLNVSYALSFPTGQSVKEHSSPQLPLVEILKSKVKLKGLRDQTMNRTAASSAKPIPFPKPSGHCKGQRKDKDTNGYKGVRYLFV